MIATSDIISLARIVYLEEGLHALLIGPSQVQAAAIAGIPLPATAVSAAPSDEYDPVEIAVSSGDIPGWLGASGGAVVVRVPLGGGIVVVTSYGIGEEAALPALQILPLGAQNTAPAAQHGPAPAPVATARDIDVEMILHIEREGDRRVAARGWVGNRGERKRVEAFSIRPTETVAPGDIEYMAFGPGGRQTPWVAGPRLCGTRGRGLPLTGFAIRLAPPLTERFDVVYEGSFFSSGATRPCRNGEPCLPQLTDDPLEAINLRVIERGHGR